jgi:hypothetical protein
MRNIRLLSRGALDGDEARNALCFIEESFDLGETDSQIGDGLRLLLAPRGITLWRDGIGALCVLVDHPVTSPQAAQSRANPLNL